MSKSDYFFGIPWSVSTWISEHIPLYNSGPNWVRQEKEKELAQLYLRGAAEVIKPAQLLGNDAAKLSHMMAVTPPLVFISTCCILKRLLIFVQFRNIRLWKISYKTCMPSPRNAASKLPQDSSECALPHALGR